MEKIILVGALPRSLINFRGELIRSLINNGCEVQCLSANNDHEVEKELHLMGASYVSYPVERSGLNPFNDLKTFWSMKSIFRNFNPNVILAYTIKPVIWGGIASKFVPNTKFYALITGLGFAFQGDSFKRKLLKKVAVFLYRTSLKNAENVIFQNSDNLEVFVSHGIVSRSKCSLVNGSGVDVKKFKFTDIPSTPLSFLMIGRILGEKGFREYVEAAKIVKKKYQQVQFSIIGPEDPSPDGISIDEVNEWIKKGYIDYLGAQSDVYPFIKKCHVYVLPSYHEGMPRTVLEAMSTGRPILTTDVPGCRETVVPGENGYLVPKQNAKALAERMIWFIENRDKWKEMGKKSRELAEEKYDVHKVNSRLLEIMCIK